MNPESNIIFYNDDYKRYLEWLNLDIKSISWHYKNQEQFEQFWHSFFIDGLSLQQIIERFAYLDDITDTGPILSWFHWLKHNFICYVFIYHQISVKKLSLLSGIPISQIATILRNYFLEQNPEQEEILNSKFQITHITSPQGELDFPTLNSIVQLDTTIPLALENEIMSRIELTLYQEWNKILRKIKKDLLGPFSTIEEFRFKEGMQKHLKIMRDLIILIITTTLILWGIKYLNQLYENYLTHQIKIYRPGFIKKIAPHIFEQQITRNTTIYTKDIKKFKDIRPTISQTTKLHDNEIFTTESDIMLSSWDKLPTSMNNSIIKKSIYEEDIKGGYRDLKFGTNKVYRILMRSVAPQKVTEKIAEYIKRYGVKQVDKVKPGTLVPGGYYYNIYVPIDYLKEFLALVMKDQEALLFENKTWRGKTPRGMNKVLIWIKSV